MATTFDKILDFQFSLLNSCKNSTIKSTEYRLFDNAKTNKITETNCVNCAAPLDYDFVKCLFCDTQFQYTKKELPVKKATIKQPVKISKELENFILNNPQVMFLSLGCLALMVRK